MVNYPRKDKTGWRKAIPSWKFVLGMASLVILGGIAAFAAAVYLFPVPAPHDVAVAESTKVLYADGKREIGRIGEVQRTNVNLEDVPEHVQQAILAAEDSGFYDHSGFSLEGISRAMINNLTGGDTQGGSTITQQYVKNAYLSHEQSFVRKFKELVLSVKLETIESKEEILGNYLNAIYFGRGAYGIQAASERYYKKSVQDLTVNEGIALAAVIKSPGSFEPELAPERLEDRMSYVRDQMLERGWLKQKKADKVELPDFTKRQRNNQLSGQRGYILEAVRREMLDVGWSEAEIEGGGLTITTTIDRNSQDAAVQAVETAGPSYNTEGLRVGLAAVEPGTGQIKAIYGGKNYLKDQLDNAMQGRALAGSTFKPFALAAALEDGYNLSSTFIGSSPATFNGYTLQNYGGASYGNVSLLRATQSSINTAYVHVASEVGVDKVIDAAVRAGIPEDTLGIDENLTFVLGTSSPRPIDMASAFSTFASGGIHAEPTILAEVKRSNGDTAYRIADRGERVFDEEVVNDVNRALQSVVNSGTATRASWIGRPAAGKTGTVDGGMGAAFVGYTPQLAAAVMMSKEDQKGNTVTLNGTGGLGEVAGGSFPTAIWAEFVRAALEGEPAQSFNAPPGVVEPSPSESESESPSPTETDKSKSPTPSSPTPTPTPVPTPSPSVPGLTPTPTSGRATPIGAVPG